MSQATKRAVKRAAVKKKPPTAKPVARNAAPAPTRRERVQSKEDAIIAAAHEMLATHGFAKTTMSEIARKAGVAEGTLYLYFNNKEALARAVLATFYRRLTELAKQGVEKRNTTTEKLEFLARHHLDSIIRERRLLELVSTTERNSETYAGSEIYKMNREYVSVFDDVMRDGVWRGDIADGGTPWIQRDIFFGSLEYAMRTVLIKKRASKKDINAVVAELVKLLTGGAGNSGKTAPLSNHDLIKAVKRVDAAAARLERLSPAKA